jgi:hypothetical protein
MEALSGADITAHVTIDFANKALRHNRSECSHLLQQQRNDAQLTILVAIPHTGQAPAIIENQPDGLDSQVISSIELSPPSRQHHAIKEVAILMISKMSLSETLMWRARAGQARRIASMLSPRDAALVEAKTVNSGLDFAGDSVVAWYGPSRCAVGA